MAKRGDFHIIKMQNKDPDAVYRWIQNDSCCIIEGSPEFNNINKDKYVGPYNITPSISPTKTVKYYLRRDCMEEAINRLKNRYS